MSRWGESIFKEEINTKDLSAFVEGKTGENHKKTAKTLRNNYHYKNLDPLNVIYFN